jgi:hypothetical protein
VRTIDHALGTALAELGIRPDGPRPLAIGWATVDLDRAAAELAAILPAGAMFRPAERSDVLGAACRVADRVPLGWPAVALLEPDTEGRLAATLARFGESWAAEWSADEVDEVGVLAARPGPFGPEWLRLGDGAYGPHHVMVRPSSA